MIGFDRIRQARKKDGQMLKRTLAEKGYGARAISRRWQTDIATINRWFAGDVPIPPAIFRLADLEPRLEFNETCEWDET